MRIVLISVRFHQTPQIVSCGCVNVICIADRGRFDVMLIREVSQRESFDEAFRLAGSKFVVQVCFEIDGHYECLQCFLPESSRRKVYGFK